VGTFGRSAGFAASAFASVIGLVACSTAPSADLGTADVNAALANVPADVSTVRGLDLPLDQSLLTPVEELEVIKARNTLMQRCLASHGITYTFPAVDPVRDAATTRRYDLVDARQAAEYGYRDPSVFATHAAGQQPSPDAVSVITGTRTGKVGGRDVPPGGCAGEADRTLAPDATPGQEPVSFSLSLRSREIAATTAPVTAAAAAWSRCMAAAGFRYSDPDAAMNDPAFSAGRPSQHEIAVATQDVRCKERVQWVKTWVAVERAVQDVLVRQHATDVHHEHQHKQRQLTVARDLNS
jgi:hypothetical protein